MTERSCVDCGRNIRFEDSIPYGNDVLCFFCDRKRRKENLNVGSDKVK